MSSIFEAYDSEFGSISQEIRKRINELKDDPADGSSSLIKTLEGLFSQSNDLIKQMEVEVRSHDPATRKVLNEKVALYKKSANSLKSDFERAKEQSQRSSLIGNKSSEQRQRLLDSNDKLNRQNEMIAKMHRTVAETEEVGNEISSELQRNREKIQSSKNKAQEFLGVTDTARQLVNSMSRRDVRQKYLIFFLAAVLVAAIIITVYYSMQPTSSR